MSAEPPATNCCSISTQRGQPAAPGLKLGHFALLLGLLFVISFPEILSLSRTLIYRDFGIFGYPLAQFAREQWWQGEVPLWNPYNNCGIPFLAQWNTMALYPLSVFYLVLPIKWALGVFCLLHLYAGGLGVFCLARRWTDSSLGAAMAGIAFTFSGLAFNCLLWPNNAAALGWMPWIVLLLENAISKGGRWILFAAVGGGCQVLAGAPEVILQTWVLVMLSFGFRPAAAEVTAPTVWRRLWRVSAVGLLIAGLTAAQMLPFLDLLAQSHRTGDYGLGVWAMPWWGWGNFLVPLLHCYSWKSGVFYQPDQYWISSYYVGAAIAMLAGVAVVFVRHQKVRVLAGICAVVLVLALGNDGWLYTLATKIIPGAGLVRYPVKFTILTTLLLPLLAAFAIRFFETTTLAAPKKVRRILFGTTLAGLALMAGWLGIMRLSPLPFDDWPATVNNAFQRAAWWGVLMLLTHFALAARETIKRVLLGLLVLLALWLDLVTHAPQLVLTANPAVLQSDLPRKPGDPSPKLGESRLMLSRSAKQFFYTAMISDPGNDFLGKRIAGFADANLLDHLPKVDGFYSLYPRAHYDLIIALYARTNEPPEALVDFLGATHVSASNDVFGWTQRGTNLSWISIGRQPEYLAGEAIKRRIAGETFDFTRQVVLPIEAGPGAPISDAARAQATLRQCTPQELRITTTSDAPAWLVVAQTFTPAWHCYVNGTPVKIWPANHAFQSVQVPAGKSEVRLVYEDHAFRWGVGISLGTIILMVLWFLPTVASVRPTRLPPS
ncbi:MAG: hypothetical protein WCO56_02415 [Verrucomicrobiota bacterium]